VQSKTLEAQVEVVTVETKEPEVIFPHIKTVYRMGELRWIKAYCKKCGIRRLGRNRVRLFMQPAGYVDEAIEIELTQGELTVYPGTHSDKEICHTLVSEGEVATIRTLVTSPEFEHIPAENKTMGYDGISYLLEVHLDGTYSWKLHWFPDDKEFFKIVDYMGDLAGSRSPTKMSLRSWKERIAEPNL
jgi:hypothetical protein